MLITVWLLLNSGNLQSQCVHDFFLIYDKFPCVPSYTCRLPGCNKTFNYGPLFYLFDHKAGLEESEYDYAMISEEEDDPEKPVDISKDWDYLFDPLYDRHLEHMQSSYEGSIVNVSKGQEIFCNYVLFSSDESKNYIQRLRAECRGEVVGTVVKVEGEQS